MYDVLHRLTLATLWLVGLATLAGLGHVGDVATLPLLHREVMLASVAAGLLVAPWVPGMRWPAVVAAVITKASLIALALAAAGNGAAGLASDGVQLVALLAAGAFLAVERRREARWNGVLPLRQEG